MSKKGKDKINGFDLPYNTSLKLLAPMLEELANAGAGGINIQTLYRDIKADKNQGRTYTLNLAKYLGLVEIDKSRAWLTPFGKIITMSHGENKNRLLAEKLPPKYSTMVKWIKHSDNSEMNVNNIKISFVESFGNISPSTVVFDRAIATFLKYIESIGLIRYIGKGRGAKARLTGFGDSVLSVPSKVEEVTKGTESSFGIKPVSLSESANYPVRIITKDRDFEWDLKNESDLAVIDSVVKSIKEEYKNKFKNKSVKSESAEDETGNESE